MKCRSNIDLPGASRGERGLRQGRWWPLTLSSWVHPFVGLHPHQTCCCSSRQGRLRERFFSGSLFLPSGPYISTAPLCSLNVWSMLTLSTEGPTGGSPLPPSRELGAPLASLFGCGSKFPILPLARFSCPTPLLLSLSRAQPWKLPLARCRSRTQRPNHNAQHELPDAQLQCE